MPFNSELWKSGYACATPRTSLNESRSGPPCWIAPRGDEEHDDDADDENDDEAEETRLRATAEDAWSVGMTLLYRRFNGPGACVPCANPGVDAMTVGSGLMGAGGCVVCSDACVVAGTGIGRCVACLTPG